MIEIKYVNMIIGTKVRLGNLSLELVDLEKVWDKRYFSKMIRFPHRICKQLFRGIINKGSDPNKKRIQLLFIFVKHATYYSKLLIYFLLNPLLECLNNKYTCINNEIARNEK